MLLAVILIFLLIGNWFLSKLFINLPLSSAVNLASLGWWTLALLSISFVAWCIGDD